MISGKKLREIKASIEVYKRGGDEARLAIADALVEDAELMHEHIEAIRNLDTTEEAGVFCLPGPHPDEE